MANASHMIALTDLQSNTPQQTQPAVSFINLYVIDSIKGHSDHLRTHTEMTPPRTYSGQTQHVTTLLGKRVKHARKLRRMTEAELAERVGVSRSTVRAIEQGSLKVEIGLFFEAAVICGVTLFTDNPTELAAHVQRIDDRLCLLPDRVRSERQEVHDDF